MGAVLLRREPLEGHIRLGRHLVGDLSHWSSFSGVQVKSAPFKSPEYLKSLSEPALRPTTPCRSGAIDDTPGVSEWQFAHWVRKFFSPLRRLGTDVRPVPTVAARKTVSATRI